MALKRVMDRRSRLPLFVLSLPVMVVGGGCGSSSASRGPAFYRQMREGIDGAADRGVEAAHDASRRRPAAGGMVRRASGGSAEWRAYFKLRHDPRVLPVIGKLLRRTSLDELPQLWSVLKGEMSLVGPRPSAGLSSGTISRASFGRCEPACCRD